MSSSVSTAAAALFPRHISVADRDSDPFLLPEKTSRVLNGLDEGSNYTIDQYEFTRVYDDVNGRKMFVQVNLLDSTRQRSVLTVMLTAGGSFYPAVLSAAVAAYRALNHAVDTTRIARAAVYHDNRAACAFRYETTCYPNVTNDSDRADRAVRAHAEAALVHAEAALVHAEAALAADADVRVVDPIVVA
jgi:hypothetical protein